MPRASTEKQAARDLTCSYAVLCTCTVLFKTDSDLSIIIDAEWYKTLYCTKFFSCISQPYNFIQGLVLYKLIFKTVIVDMFSVMRCLVFREGTVRGEAFHHRNRRFCTSWFLSLFKKFLLPFNGEGEKRGWWGNGGVTGTNSAHGRSTTLNITINRFFF